MAEIAELITVQNSTWTAAGELFYELTIQPILIVINSGVAELITTTGYLSYAIKKKKKLFFFKRFTITNW